MKSLEWQIICLLFIDLVGCHGIVRNIFHISFSPVEGSVKHGCGDAVDIWMLFPLNLMELFNKALMMLVNFHVVMENLFYEFV